MSSQRGRALLGVAAIIAIVLSYLAGSSVAPPREVTVTATVTLTRTVTPGPPVITVKGQRVKLNETFTVLCGVSGESKIAVQVTFIRAWYTETFRVWKADKGYKFLVVDVSIRNVGFKETYAFGDPALDPWTVRVDKGYTYKSTFVTSFPGKVRPEEIKTGYIVFEILADTRAVEVFGRIMYADLDVVLEL